MKLVNVSSEGRWHHTESTKTVFFFSTAFSSELSLYYSVGPILLVPIKSYSKSQWDVAIVQQTDMDKNGDEMRLVYCGVVSDKIIQQRLGFYNGYQNIQQACILFHQCSQSVLINCDAFYALSLKIKTFHSTVQLWVVSSNWLQGSFIFWSTALSRFYCCYWLLFQTFQYPFSSPPFFYAFQEFCSFIYGFQGLVLLVFIWVFTVHSR